MVKKFNNTAQATPLSEAEAFLQKESIEYQHRDDGTIFVPGGINLSGRGLTKLPDLSNVHVGGNFWCDYNQLTSLAGAPQNVGVNFWCDYNHLSDLYGAPRTFQGLKSDFGTFSSWDEIPDDVKMSAQTKQRLEEKVIRDVHDAMYNSPATPFKPPPRRKRPEV